MAKDKVVLITGASRGIGRATAMAMARAGAYVAAAARTAEQLRALAQEILVKRMVGRTMAHYGRIDVLVNNAGFNTRKAPLWEVTTEEWDAMMAVNLRGAFLCCREVLPGMIERRSGHIVNIVSTVTQAGIENMGAYSATKWGLLGMTKVLIKEARPYGIRVSALSPGGTDTSFRDSPRPAYLSPETVADAIVYVISLPEKAVVHEWVMRPMVETNF